MVAMRLPWRSAGSTPAAAPPSLPRDPDDRFDRLSDIMIARGLCDARGLDRARRIADESGQRIDAVLIQLGLLTERGLAAAYAELLSLPVASPARFPSEPILPERLTARFLRTCPRTSARGRGRPARRRGGRPARPLHPGRDRLRDRPQRHDGDRRSDRAGSRLRAALPRRGGGSRGGRCRCARLRGGRRAAEGSGE